MSLWPQYFFLDLYFADDKDKNAKLIYKVEDRFNQYFEIYAPQENGKYAKI